VHQLPFSYLHKIKNIGKLTGQILKGVICKPNIKKMKSDQRGQKHPSFLKPDTDM